jgi:hypothetical protein
VNLPTLPLFPGLRVAAAALKKRSGYKEITDKIALDAQPPLDYFE